MGNDSSDIIVRLGNAAVVLQRGADTSHFVVHTASLAVLPGRRPVRLRLDGPEGSVIVSLSRIAFWRLTAEFHERSIRYRSPQAERKAHAPGAVMISPGDPGPVSPAQSRAGVNVEQSVVQRGSTVADDQNRRRRCRQVYGTSTTGC